LFLPLFIVGKITRKVDPKAAVPKRDEKPIHGLVSDKNFIVANAVENILAGKLFTWQLLNRLKMQYLNSNRMMSAYSLLFKCGRYYSYTVDTNDLIYIFS